MRFEFRLFRTVLLTGATICLSPLLRGQEPTQGAAGEIPPRIDEAKVIAQQAALPKLRGEDGYILRESAWAGELEPGKARLLQVQLFKRNGYHFWFAVPDQRAAVNLNLYNGNGELVPTTEHRYPTTNIVGLEISPESTGIYFLRVSLQTNVQEPQSWSVIYAWR